MQKFFEKKSYKWEVLLLLWMAYLLNQGDRQVFNTVLPAIREALNLTDTSVGLIATIFNLFYAAMVPLVSAAVSMGLLIVVHSTGK